MDKIASMDAELFIAIATYSPLDGQAVIGVHADEAAALQRCRDTDRDVRDQHGIPEFQSYWVEVWVLGATKPVRVTETVMGSRFSESPFR